ncbi:GNAT family N-acetyltransferase [Chloroflexota bacterium]
MKHIEIKPVRTRRDRNKFLTFPWKIYRGDPLWVPPLLPERRKLIDPDQGKFFQDGYADLFIAMRDGKPAGTISCAEDLNARRTRGFGECTIGFFECLQDIDVAEALFSTAENWSREHDLGRMVGTWNLDREDSRGILIDGRDQPAAVYCGYNPSYYRDFFELYGFEKHGDDGLAYRIDVDLNTRQARHLLRLADKIRSRKNIIIRGANLEDYDAEIDRVLDLQNRGLAHMPGHVPYTRSTIESMIQPMLKVVDPELVLFAEIDGKAVGWFPGVPNLNEVFIHLNGLRYPWNYLNALRFSKYKPESISIKSVVVPPEYWDTGVGVLLFAEMAKRLVEKGYKWADLSLTGEDNTDTYPLAHRMGARIYKRYRFFTKQVEPA